MYYEIQGEIIFSCGNQKIIQPMIKTCAFVILNHNLWVTTSKQHYDCIEIGLSTIYHEYFEIDILHTIFFMTLTNAFHINICESTSYCMSQIAMVKI